MNKGLYIYYLNFFADSYGAQINSSEGILVAAPTLE